MLNQVHGDVLPRRLLAFTTLPDEDTAAIEAVGARSQRELLPRRDLVREGDEPKSVFLILDGWACRYKTLPDGRRQIVSFCIPGDLCDTGIQLLGDMDHGVAAITRLKLAEIARDDFDALLANRPRLARAVRCGELIAASIQREWALSLGQRTALERIAHLLCETQLRLEVAGLGHGDSCDFPLTQVDLADATGLTPVHVNRTLQELRRCGLIQLQNKKLSIIDKPALRRAALFNENYLHLGSDTGIQGES